jgi:hypothetical protein
MHQTRAARKFVRVTATLFMAVMAGPIMLSAATLEGNLSLSSHGTETIAVNGTDIDFDFTGTAGGGFPPVVTSGTVDGTGDSGLFDITAASTGTFGPLSGTTTAVHDLSVSMEPVGSTVGPELPLINFITFTAVPNLNIALTMLNAGTDDNACNGTSEFCTPAGSPFNLQNENGATQTSGNVLVGFTFVGTMTDGFGDVSAVSGTFSTTFADTSYQAILADLTAGDSIVSAANATIGVTPITATPEPASIYMFLLGSALLMGSEVYRRHQSGVIIFGAGPRNGCRPKKT